MKYFHLVWTSLFRRKPRAIFTLSSIAAAFLLFGLLDSVRLAFSAGDHLAGAGRLLVVSRRSIQQPLPVGLGSRIQEVPGLAGVAWTDYFIGTYQDPKNQVVGLAVSPTYFSLNPELVLPADQHAEWDKTRSGAVVGAALARKFGWKIGDQVPLRSGQFRSKSTGDDTWTFDIVGIFHAEGPTKLAREQAFMFHWKYLDENNAFGSGTVHWYVVKVADPGRADAVAKAIDALSANSDHETRTQTEQAYQASLIKQLVNLGLVVSAIMVAVLFTLLLITGNTMMQTVRERRSELAVLKAVGFSETTILILVLTESGLLLLLGGLIGLGIVSLVVPGIAAASGGIMPTSGLSGHTWLTGIALMVSIGVLVGILPGLQVLRVSVVDGLSER